MTYCRVLLYTVWQVIFRGANFMKSQNKPLELIFMVLHFVTAYKHTALRMRQR